MAGWLFLIGVMTASILWFSGLTMCCRLLHKRFTPRVIVWVNRVCGVIIALYGIKLLVDFVLLVG